MKHQEYIRLVPGAKTAVLFIHGIMGTPDHFLDLIPHVPRDWSVCNILLPGHGKSVSDFGASSMDQWRSRANQVFEKHSCLAVSYWLILIEFIFCRNLNHNSIRIALYFSERKRIFSTGN